MTKNKNILLLYLALAITLVISISIYIFANKPMEGEPNEEEVKLLLLEASEKLYRGLQKTDTLSIP